MSTYVSEIWTACQQQYVIRRLTDLVDPHGVEPELVEHGVGLVPRGERGEEVPLALRLDLDGIGDHQRSLLLRHSDHLLQPQDQLQLAK